MSLLAAVATFDWDVEETARRLAQLPPGQQEEARCRRHPERLREYVASRHLLAATRALLPHAHNPRWSVSHCGDMAACVWSADVACGIDLEKRDRRIDPLPIAERYFAADEYEWLSRLPPGQQPNGFLDLWTRKEACIKALGKGIAGHLDLVRFGQDGDHPVNATADGLPLRVRRFHDPAWMLAVAWRGAPRDVRLLRLAL